MYRLFTNSLEEKVVLNLYTVARLSDKMSAKTLFQSDIQKIMVSNYVIQILFTFLGDPVSEPISAKSSDLTTTAATAAAGWWAA